MAKSRSLQALAAAIAASTSDPATRDMFESFSEELRLELGDLTGTGEFDQAMKRIDDELRRGGPVESRMIDDLINILNGRRHREEQREIQVRRAVAATIEYSRPMGPAKLGKVLGFHARAMTRMLNDGTIPNARKYSDRSYAIPIDQIPAAFRDKCRVSEKADKRSPK